MYYILYSLFFLVSLLPMRVLYFFADLMFLIVYHAIGYRRKVVMQNLRRAFPDKSETELHRIEKQFYHNMIDSFVETFKLITASRNFLQKRVTANWDILKSLHESGRNCQVHLGHTFNWEWGQHVLQMNTGYQVLVVYSPLSSKSFERLMLKIRTRFGSKFIRGTDMKSSIVQYNNVQYLLGLVADQSPANPANAYWLNFLNQPTAFVPGPEKGARNNNLPVVYASVYKKRRGYYHAELSVISEEPTQLKEGELTRRYAELLEQNIRSHPENWLWSHRRWKLAYKPEYLSQWIGQDAPPVITEEKSQTMKVAR
ncbi:lysophospholipid acyltransferase family protein [Pollutibacter soli]|uniref:lysophospholipid acyltransferase family protein n=1 Tax=Pollutibacter soli TaxID=3034157 RepID=UPI0030140B2E